MDEEKQNDGLVKKAGEAIKKGAEKQAKQGVKQVLKKVIMTIAPVLLKAIAIALIIYIVITAITDFLDKITGKSSKDANAFAVQYSNGGSTNPGTGDSEDDGQEEVVDNRIIIDLDNVTEDGAYKLVYEFKDENGTALTEEQAISNIKYDLAEENDDIDLSLFSESELKIIGVLMYNGLKVEKYTEAELKALVIFLKADIASRNFDLRSGDEAGQPAELSNLSKNDEVYGTLAVYKTSVGTDGKYKKERLEYLPYEEFSALKEQKNQSLLNKFTLNEDGELVIARLSTSNTTYSYLNESGGQLSAAELQQIPEENMLEDVQNTYVVASQPLNHKQFINRYIMTYGFLSDLLIITDNVDFCLELADLALNNKLIINVKEELTITNTETTTNFTQTTLLYDYIKYEVSGQKRVYSWSNIKQGDGNPRDEETLVTIYGWDPEMEPTNVQGSSSGGTTTYEWSHRGSSYQLKFTSTLTRQNWTLYRRVMSYQNLTTERNVSAQGDLINLENNHITESYDGDEGYTINEGYTDKEIFKYTRKANTYSESRSYKFEISEIDSWYIKYNKQYEEPVHETKSSSGGIQENGQFPQEKETVQEPTTNSSIINSDEHVVDFIDYREDKYKDDYPEAVNINCNVTELTIKQRVKTDFVETYESTTNKYKFGEEIADTTEAKIKNVEFVNSQPTYTSTGADGNPEIGFLSIYDRYRKAEVDLFLQDDAEKRLFGLLESDSETASKSNIIKYLLYVYDGQDRGVTSLQIKIIDISKLMRVNGKSTENYIKAWENGGLWLYETGQSDVIPTNYLTEDEINYIVYEDGSAGHNNIAYGWATFISNDKNVRTHHPVYGDGYYNWKEAFASEGIIVENLYEGAYVDKLAADAVFYNVILPNFENAVDSYLETNLPEYEFTQAQKDALISVNYQYGNIIGFDEVYKSAINEDGTLDGEKLRNWSRFNYSGTVNDRKYANWLLFTEGKYIDRSGNEIQIGYGSIVEAAYAVADHFMYSGVDVHYSGNDVDIAANNGRHCVYSNIQGSWDLPIEQPERYGVVCATFVALAIWQAGLVDTETMNQYGYNACGGIDELLTKSKYADEWEIIVNWDDLQEGDIVYMKGHVFIYMEGEKCLDQNYCVISSRGRDLRGMLLDASAYRYDFIRGYRYIG